MQTSRSFLGSVFELFGGRGCVMSRQERGVISIPGPQLTKGNFGHILILVIFPNGHPMQKDLLTNPPQERLCSKKETATSCLEDSRRPLARTPSLPTPCESSWMCFVNVFGLGLASLAQKTWKLKVNLLGPLGNQKVNRSALGK